ncbi:hypothetical protein MRB53_028945 [Persea americana]|uniref:Uncharacterized protein n=1 Tax=Persea americana TaxID=3435 RepID=A0ACC2KH55_PERAE|nr:hypothetical protein MRB53_028945 [Persea americana]
MPITVGSRRDFSTSMQLDETLILDGVTIQSQSQMSRSARRRFDQLQTFEDGATTQSPVFDSIARRPNESLIPRWSDESLIFNALAMPSHFRASRQSLESRTFQSGVTMPSQMFNYITRGEARNAERKDPKTKIMRSDDPTTEKLGFFLSSNSHHSKVQVKATCEGKHGRSNTSWASCCQTKNGQCFSVQLGKWLKR